MAVRNRLLLELTDRCNFKCTFCRSVRLQKNDILDYDAAIQCLDELKDETVAGCYMTSAQLNGNGEALLYPRLDEIIVEVRKRFPNAELVTNASLLTEERIEKLLNTDIDMIEISLTGITPEVYQHFQGSGISLDACEKQLKRVMANVHLLLKKRDEMKKHTYIRLRYIRSRELGSYQAFKEYVRYWKNSGVDEIFVTSLWNFRRPKNAKKVLRCYNVGGIMQVCSNGNVMSCGCNFDLDKYAFGNVYQESVRDIVRSEAFQLDKNNKLTCDLNTVPKTCLSCENRAYRNLFEELSNRRLRIFPKRPIKSALFKFYGIGVIIYERIMRNDILFKAFWAYRCRRSKKIHDEFQKNGRRIEGEHK